MGGKAFTVPCSLVRNGTYVDRISALPDSGANGFAFLNTQCAKDIIRFLGCKATQLPQPIVAKGYDGVRGQSITHYLSVDLLLDGRRLVEIPFLILDLANHDIILGANQMAYFDIQPDLRRRKLVWPVSLPQTCEQSFARKIRVTRESIKPRLVDPEYQTDILRRQRLFDQDEARRTAGKFSRCIPQILLKYRAPTVEDTDEGSTNQIPPVITDIPDNQITDLQPTITDDDLVITTSYGATFARKMAKDIVAMETSFQIAEIEMLRDDQFYEDQRLAKLAKRLYQQQDLSIDPSILDICEISAVAFHLNLRRKENELFSISFYDIDYKLQFRQAQITDEEQDEILDKLPASYRPYLKDFSKATSDILPPHRLYDHKIELEANCNLGHSPLYSQSTEELLALKKYLSENLDRGFIETSQAPFSSPVLFVRKANGSLRFCIDFRKLNAITRKDRYPLPLIEETLARLTRAKIFTKLDIRQAFHRIRMDTTSEDLTTFRTRYGSYKCKVLTEGLTNGPATY